jgi:glycosyltransferase involved in cell wall biosynthesis
MVGGGPERERLRRKAAEQGLTNVIFGESPYDEMAELYSTAFAAVATLRDVPVAKGMRLSKIFPALSCSVPVIYAGNGEAAELLASQRCGVVVAPEQPAALAQAMRELADDRQRRDRLGAAGRAFVERDYSWSTIVGRWLAEVGIERRGQPEAAVVSEPVRVEGV